MEFSVLMSVYMGDEKGFLKEAILSICNQTLQPNEIIIVMDGPVKDGIINLLDGLKNKYPIIRLVRLKKNYGLGIALREGLKACRYRIIARMDSDDISAPDRFEKQIKYMKKNPHLALIGGNIKEFIGQVENVVGRRVVPQNNVDIYNYMQRRCPFNHVSVMFRRSAVEQAGGYLPWPYNEDYYLWLRMAYNNFQFYNLQDDLVFVRVGTDMYQRRGGGKYFMSEFRLQVYMLKNKFIGPCRFLINSILRLVLQVFMPNIIRGWIFRNLARQ